MIAWLRRLFGYQRPSIPEREARDPELDIAKRLHAARSARVRQTVEAATNVAQTVRADSRHGVWADASRRLGGG